MMPLSDATRSGGVKAYRLRLLIDAGLRVPPGFVMSVSEVTPRAVEEACSSSGCSFPAAVRISPPEVGLAEFALSAIGLRVAEGPEDVPYLATWLISRAAEVTPAAAGSMIIVQSLVASPKASGAAYTVSPITWFRRLIVEAVPGLGDEFMSVGSPHDSFTFDLSLRLVERRVMRKASARRYVPGRGVVAIPMADPWTQSLSDEEAREVASYALRAEEAVGGPLELEWAYSSGPWALGARPLPRQKFMSM
ncbi:Phosphoenolpyruvate synthase (PEPS) [Acidilobus saccharovorans 345-15]|uniref:Phosphoenolpyruvate synthase (PEPS) n=1 Tax=Acidilobus saccharovorans (strain DSM 16705 / JCM 18335 / VKM B-2471 / 345-15) TaxID=666510 RepID=D9PZA1_ACIS3|nr:phosphoenolpyruvate synthase (PEPS) [Acidilobus saccharovorans]ADL19888.1 Phosphoenolpyruvate synthase (PEPS) [Acidilobus saccharovorans 345-15]